MEQTLGRGHYSNDSAIHEAAKGTEIYSWADKIEGEVRSLFQYCSLHPTDGECFS